MLVEDAIKLIYIFIDKNNLISSYESTKFFQTRIPIKIEHLTIT